jgi:hypothetical protein
MLPAHMPSGSKQTQLTAQSLFDNSIKLHYEEKHQFSGPRNKKISIESVLVTINTTERRKHKLVGFLKVFFIPKIALLPEHHCALSFSLSISSSRYCLYSIPEY